MSSQSEKYEHILLSFIQEQSHFIISDDSVNDQLNKTFISATCAEIGNITGGAAKKRKKLVEDPGHTS